MYQEGDKTGSFKRAKRIKLAIIALVLALTSIGVAIWWAFRPVAVDTARSGTPAPANGATIAGAPSPGSNRNISNTQGLALPAEFISPGVTELETADEPVYLHVRDGRITSWLVKEGEFVNQDRQLAMYSHSLMVAQINGPANDQTFSGELRTPGPFVLKKILVPAGQEFASGQELCRIGKPKHVQVRTTVDKNWLPFLPVGTTAYFEIGSEAVFKGKVQTLDQRESVVVVTLDDAQIFDPSGLLNLGPRLEGTVSFTKNTPLE